MLDYNKIKYSLSTNYRIIVKWESRAAFKKCISLLDITFHHSTWMLLVDVTQNDPFPLPIGA